MQTFGVLYIVSTPIGNLEDITLRALRILKEVGLIAAEDTRRTRKLLTHYEIHTPITSYYTYNKFVRGMELIEELKAGKNIALVSDSGTPGISDPGIDLIKLAISHSIKVVPVPGPSAVISALVGAGFSTHEFVFVGFLSKKNSHRKKELMGLKDEKKTIIIYESPYRVKDTMQNILEILGDRNVVICRELTKLYEEFIRGKASEVVESLKTKTLRGECTIVIKNYE
ncbi:MAG: 16S rRNA (cytidine(1402)-2'-O)-methyltransferase [Candidatus Firestonebacteria bacterium]